MGSVDNTYPAEGWWIEGVSVAMYPYACNGFGLCAGGIEIVQLNRVTLADGTVIYESPETGIETPGSDNEACEDCPSEVYNLQGQRVGLSVEGLAPGIYVRKCDDGSQKIRVK